MSRIINDWRDFVGDSLYRPTLYPITRGAADNTTVETDLILATVPGGTWLDGEMITVEMAIKALCHTTGGSSVLTLKANGGNGSATIFSQEFFDGNTTPVRFTLAWNFIREGSTIVVMRPHGMLFTDYLSGIEPVLYRLQENQALSGGAAGTNPEMAVQTATQQNAGGIISSADFADDQTLGVSATWSVAGATVYFNCIGGRVQKG